MVQLNTPPMLRGGGQAQLAQMRSYLYQLAEQLNGALNAIEADSLTDGAKATLGSGAAESAAQQVREDMGKTSSVLKDLIIKTAESVRSAWRRSFGAAMWQRANSGHTRSRWTRSLPRRRRT